ncbi:zinc finger 271-like [Paramuricea clavata]|uniref:Zinc finger 271-like n=1 Tax=Paramuricea clavata TaxID=317549 RepID=A0A6S7K2U7_PARCT|nr:zinc finger 271-like [Paramuricea clavata]
MSDQREERHNRAHTSGEPLNECDVSKKKFYKHETTSHFAAHKKRRHKKDKSYECDVWDKPYECDVCKKRFRQSGHLTTHKQTHTGDRPYECDVCKKNCHKEIIEPQDLQGHFAEDKSIGKYACNKCNKRFSNFMTLVQHIARHHGNDGNYQCGLCQELESTEPTGVGYVCCVCDVVFDVPRDLEDHMATHDSM